MQLGIGLAPVFLPPWDLQIAVNHLNRLALAFPNEGGTQNRMARGEQLPGTREGRFIEAAVQFAGQLLEVNPGTGFQQRVKKQTGLQRTQRVDIVNAGGLVAHANSPRSSNTASSSSELRPASWKSEDVYAPASGLRQCSVKRRTLARKPSERDSMVDRRCSVLLKIQSTCSRPPVIIALISIQCTRVARGLWPDSTGIRES